MPNSVQSGTPVSDINWNKNLTLETWAAPENNKRAICDKLVDIFAGQSLVLEIGSGTGQHAVLFGQQMPHLVWQTSDQSENLGFIRQRLEAEAGNNILAPIELDVDAGKWPDQKYDGVYSANCIHIMGWSSVEAMFAGIGSLVAPGGRVALYGPFKYKGDFTTQSNADFDVWLKSRNPVSGIRDFDAVDALAAKQGMRCVADHAMPANNQLIVWQMEA